VGNTGTWCRKEGIASIGEVSPMTAGSIWETRLFAQIISEVAYKNRARWRTGIASAALVIAIGKQIYRPLMEQQDRFLQTI